MTHYRHAAQYFSVLATCLDGFRLRSAREVPLRRLHEMLTEWLYPLISESRALEYVTELPNQSLLEAQRIGPKAW